MGLVLMTGLLIGYFIVFKLNRKIMIDNDSVDLATRGMYSFYKY